MNFNNDTQKSLEAVRSARDLAVGSGHQQMERVQALLRRYVRHAAETMLSSAR